MFPNARATPLGTRVIGSTTRAHGAPGCRDGRHAARLRHASPHRVSAESLHRLSAALCVLVIVATHWPQLAAASCNQIPGTATSFRGVRGSVDRPFARPGDFVELRHSPLCDAPSPGFAAAAADHVVTLAFVPATAAPHLVVLAPSCAALSDALDSCWGGDATVVCRTRGADDVQVVDDDGVRRLRFRFPDTDDLVGASDDGRTLAGPTRIAVSRTDAPLPCELLRSPCRSSAGATLACVDELYRIDGTCGETLHDTFTSFTALPASNDYQALCVEPSSVCTARAAELRFTVDAAGNVLLPMDWRGVLPPQSPDSAANGTLPPARLLRVNAAIDALGDGSAPLRVPNNAFLHSYAPNGGLLPPLFEPQTDPDAADRLILFGSADAPETVLRIARRSPAFQQCHDGSADGRPCAVTADCPEGACGAARCVGGSADGSDCEQDADCPGGECGATLFDFRPRMTDGGPIAVARFGSGLCQDSLASVPRRCTCPSSRCVGLSRAAEDPVPLEGLIESADLFATVVPEAIDGRDLNGDGDSTDNVLLLAIGAGVAASRSADDAPGRAATRIQRAAVQFSGCGCRRRSSPRSSRPSRRRGKATRTATATSSIRSCASSAAVAPRLKSSR